MKIRAIYFGIIKAERVEGLVDDIFDATPTLDDIKFLLKYARQIFPGQPVDIVPKKIYRSLVALRDRLRAERAAGMELLRRALADMYSDVETENVDELTKAVGKLFRKTVNLKKLAADAGTYFPVEFQSADPIKVRKMFVEERKALGGGDSKMKQ